MMRFVIAHEVGCFRLPHNMGASNAYDVESYRNGAFTQKNMESPLNGHARYNYIQPGDKDVRFIRQMGP
jgi:hypothetical protein